MKTDYDGKILVKGGLAIHSPVWYIFSKWSNCNFIVELIDKFRITQKLIKLSLLLYCKIAVLVEIELHY